ncbi:MAG TPA: hypothetical protein DHV36_09940, partial [Desulfobacteraceae bacterium]|nr:hypothetical protein [Desulfobacteraceae bacterium]
MFSRITIKVKLLICFLLVSLIPLVIVTQIAVSKANTAIETQVASKFAAVQQAKADHIRDIFRKLETSMKVIMKDPYLQSSMATFIDAFEQNGNTIENSVWETMV